jgi:hypothetical protein
MVPRPDRLEIDPPRLAALRDRMERLQNRLALAAQARPSTLPTASLHWSGWLYGRISGSQVKRLLPRLRARQVHQWPVVEVAPSRPRARGGCVLRY